MGAVEAVEFLQKDHGDIGSGFRQSFAEDLPIKSLLQRQGKTVEDLLKMFDWNEDDAKWQAEYDRGPQGEDDIGNLIRLKRRISFAIGGWRETKEDFERGDVSCMRDIRVPFVTSRSPLKAMKDEFNE